MTDLQSYNPWPSVGEFTTSIDYAYKNGYTKTYYGIDMGMDEMRPQEEIDAFIMGTKDGAADRETVLALGQEDPHRW